MNDQDVKNDILQVIYNNLPSVVKSRSMISGRDQVDGCDNDIYIVGVIESLIILLSGQSVLIEIAFNNGTCGGTAGVVDIPIADPDMLELINVEVNKWLSSVNASTISSYSRYGDNQINSK